MKISAISIFPEYFDVLSLSLIGKAQQKDVIQFDAIDLRDYAEGNHKSVDDTPYGGGAGMVMSPEPWGAAIDKIASETSATIDLVVLTPSGRNFNQRLAEELARVEHLVFACGRYEGIDARVSEYYRTNQRFRVHEISIGDYVLNGGEVAALVLIESIVRLLPGVLGNPKSLAEESHVTEGEVEYPVYTKPAQWRGFEVPEVLLSGNHQAIAQWRREEALRRSERRLRGE